MLRRPRLADEVGSDAIPGAAGGGGGHGAARPDGVIHRYISKSAKIARFERRLSWLRLS